MAQKRMFSKSITSTDKFLDMPATTQNLYFHLNMNADDDGFVGSPRTVMRTVGASQDDMNILIGKQFLLVFESGVIVIKDWKIHNYIRKDTYKATIYSDEMATLSTEENNSYTNRPRIVDLDKSSIDKNSIDKNSIDKTNNNAIPYKEIIDHLNQKTGKRYSHKSNANQKLIKARWNEGYVLDDFIKAIDNMVAVWTGTDYEKYLQPSTLFRESNFDRYVNQTVKLSAQATNVPAWAQEEYKPKKQTEKDKQALARLKAQMMGAEATDVPTDL